MIEAGLVLEGGGMRGVYTAGVLDALMDHDVWFRDVYGVSAGACHGCSYVSKQRGRAIRTVLDYVDDSRYAGPQVLLKTGNLFGVRLIYEDIPQKLLPFDYDAYLQSGMRLFCSVFDCETGETVHLQAKDLRVDMPLVLASSSMPLVSCMVHIDAKCYLDGGIGNSIPIDAAIAGGHPRNVFVLTQHRGYQKERASRMLPLIKARYRKYPKLAQAMERRHLAYNEQLQAVYNQEAMGNAVVIQPKNPVNFRTLEKDKNKLRALYTCGIEDANAAMDRVRALFTQQA